MKAVIAGGGIGGLAAAVALHRRGVDVIVLERDEQRATAGAALSPWPNALRGLDRLSISDQVRRHAALGGDSGIRRPDGRWLARTRAGDLAGAGRVTGIAVKSGGDPGASGKQVSAAPARSAISAALLGRGLGALRPAAQ